jgi:hypothetical protein
MVISPTIKLQQDGKQMAYNKIVNKWLYIKTWCVSPESKIVF